MPQSASRRARSHEPPAQTNSLENELVQWITEKTKVSLRLTSRAEVHKFEGSAAVRVGRRASGRKRTRPLDEICRV